MLVLASWSSFNLRGSLILVVTQPDFSSYWLIHLLFSIFIVVICSKNLSKMFVLVKWSSFTNVSSFSFLQFCRYLFYLGKIRTIQLEYTDAKESLLQAARKAPQAALGFRVQCNRWAIIVRLLLGEIPERTVFVQKDMEKALRPYFELTNVRMTLFNFKSSFL